MNRPVSKPLITLVTALIVAVTFSAGFLIGKQEGIRSVVPAGEGKVIGVGEIPASLNKDVKFSLFWDVWDLIKDEYVDQPVSEKELFYGAMKGLVWSLGDQHSTFFDPVTAAAFAEELSGSFEGIGAEIEVKDDQLQIVAPLPESPAERAGLMAGDAILAIDGLDTAGMASDEAVKHIRGPKDTDVTLTIRRGEDEARDVVITRDTIEIDSVTYQLRDDGIAVITISFFNGDTSRLFTDAARQALTDGASGIILDLRNDPGGYLTAAIDVASAWVGTDTVVIEKIRDQEEKTIGRGPALLNGLATVVLVNGGSASASEIVAGALQDHDQATIVGEQTFGKGSVQDYRDLPDGSAVKLTVARWYTPANRSIDQQGITPDLLVEMTAEDYQAERDPQMDKAVEILNGNY
ncbi:MAG: S41 family peptidase [Patescibacteria group bacterium]